MNELLELEPFFWLSLICGLIGILYGWHLRRTGIGFPVMIACVTILVWYHGDVLYNGYSDSYRTVFQEHTLTNAWIQVSIFFVSFLFLVTYTHRIGNGQYFSNSSSAAYRLATDHRMLDSVQEPLSNAWTFISVTWLWIKSIGLWRLDFDFLGYFFPYIAGYRLAPWFRGRLGGGYDSLITIVSYLDFFCLGAIGVVAALSYSAKIRAMAVLFIFLSWPEILFDRTRNLMIAVVLPGLIAFAFVRLHGRILLQVATLVLCFLGFDFWFRFVMSNRNTGSISDAFVSGKLSSNDSRHHGLNMFEELCWINMLTESGEYRPNFGMRYFAEMVNPIPRVLWKDKPMIGIDWAVARGQGGNTADDSGVHATISTGLIGQGSVNFGLWFGPSASAFLLSIWCTILARFDLTAQKPGRMLMYAVGSVLTFNMGRDISLLILYPVGFAYILFSLQRPRMLGGLQSPNAIGVAQLKQTRSAIKVKTS